MNRCNSGTDSNSLDERRRVWHFAMLFFDAYTLEGNFPGVYHQEGVFFYDSEAKDPSYRGGRPAGGGGRRPPVRGVLHPHHARLHQAGHLRPARPAGHVLPGPRLRRGHPAGEEPAAPALRLQRRRGRAVQLPAGRGVRLYRRHGLQEPQKAQRRPVGLRGRRRSHGAHQPAHQLFHRLPRLCGAVRPAAGGHRGHVSGNSGHGGAGAHLQRPAELPAGVQRALHPVQGAAGRGAVLPDLQAAEPPAA